MADALPEKVLDSVEDIEKARTRIEDTVRKVQISIRADGTPTPRQNTALLETDRQEGNLSELRKAVEAGKLSPALMTYNAHAGKRVVAELLPVSGVVAMARAALADLRHWGVPATIVAQLASMTASSIKPTPPGTPVDGDHARQIQ